jgi:radical SAM superfamily enzyme YgiQ (UPF0313 family)
VFAGYSLDCFKDSANPANKRIVPIQTGVGCYWGRCHYCNFNVPDENVFYEKPHDIAMVIRDYYLKLGASVFLFTIDCIPPKWIKSLYWELKQLDLVSKLTFISFFRCGKFDNEFYEILKDMNFYDLSIGVESFSPRVLQLMKKGVTVDVIHECLQQLNERGITHQINIIYDYPGICRSDIKQNLKYIEHYAEQILALHLSRTYIVPRTGLLEEGLRKRWLTKSSNRQFIHKYPFQHRRVSNLMTHFNQIGKIVENYVFNRSLIQHNMLYLHHKQTMNEQIKLSFNKFIKIDQYAVFATNNYHFQEILVTNSEVDELLASVSTSKDNQCVVEVSGMSQHVQLFLLYCIKYSVVHIHYDKSAVSKKISYYDYKYLYLSLKSNFDKSIYK